jgi:hypothetical protein
LIFLHLETLVQIGNLIGVLDLTGLLPKLMLVLRLPICNGGYVNGLALQLHHGAMAFAAFPFLRTFVAQPCRAFGAKTPTHAALHFLSQETATSCIHLIWSILVFSEMPNENNGWSFRGWTFVIE